MVEGWEVGWGCGGWRWCEGERGGGDDIEEFGAGVGWEVDVWDAWFVEEVRSGGCYDEEGGEVGDLGYRSIGVG